MLADTGSGATMSMRRAIAAGIALVFVVLTACRADSDQAAQIERADLSECEQTVPTNSGDAPLTFADQTDEQQLAGLDLVTIDLSTMDDPEQAAETMAVMPIIMAGGASVVDLNGDGWEDLYLPRVGLPNLLLMNNCGTGFTELYGTGTADPAASTSGVFADIDGDQDLDLYVSNMFEGPDRLYRNDGGFTFTDITDTQLQPATDPLALTLGASFGDLDRDGDLDLVTSRWFDFGGNGGLSEVLVNDGAGNFSGAQLDGMQLDDVAAFTATITDVNADARPDLLLAADWGSSRLFTQEADGSFADVTADRGLGTDENGMGSAVVDINADGMLDWFITAIYSEGDCTSVGFGCTGNRLFLGDDARFTDATGRAGLREGGWGWGTAVEDFDNDGDLDVAMTNGFPSRSALSEEGQQLIKPFEADPVRLWLQADDGTFAEVSGGIGFKDDGQGKSLIAFDHDRDGDLDILVVNTDTGPRLFRNELGASNSWLQVAPLLTPGGAPAVGAIVRAGGPRSEMRRDIRVGDTYGGQRSSIAHFGFGATDADATATITVTWPDGSETRHDLALNQRHRLAPPGE